MGESLGIAIQVLADWRVIAVTVATIAIWTTLRQVGLVYKRPKAPAKAKAKKSPPPPPVRAPAAEDGEEMVE
jgi:hypothetical protein